MVMLKRLAVWVCLMLIGAGYSGCDGGADEASLESLSGIWTATRFEYVSTTSSAPAVDLVALGGSATLNLNDAGPYALTITPANAAEQTMLGPWSYTMDTLTLHDDSSSMDVVFALNMGNDKLTLSGGDVEFDFNGDGADEPAKLNMALVR